MSEGTQNNLPFAELAASVLRSGVARMWSLLPVTSSSTPPLSTSKRRSSTPNNNNNITSTPNLTTTTTANSPIISVPLITPKFPTQVPSPIEPEISLRQRSDSTPPSPRNSALEENQEAQEEEEDEKAKLTSESTTPISTNVSLASPRQRSSSFVSVFTHRKRKRKTLDTSPLTTTTTTNNNNTNKQQQQPPPKPPRPDETLYKGDDLEGSLAKLLLNEAANTNCSLQKIREICWQRGIPANSRPVIWRLLLGITPQEHNIRIDFAETRREEYLKLVKIHVGNPNFEPRNELETSLFKQITVDVIRTHPTGFSNLFHIDCISEMLKRILIVWSSCNTNIGYFQGLNELVAPFIIVYTRELFGGRDISTNDVSSLWENDLQTIEADSYYSLCSVMEQLKPYTDAAISKLHAEHMVVRIETVLFWANKELAIHLSNCGIRAAQYAFRWSLCLMLRESPLKDALIVWDAAISDPQGQGFGGFIIYVCAFYILQFSGILMGMNADSAMLFLHSPPFIWTEEGVNSLVSDAKKLQQKHEQYETQREMLLKQDISRPKSPIPIQQLQLPFTESPKTNQNQDSDSFSNESNSSTGSLPISVVTSPLTAISTADKSKSSPDIPIGISTPTPTPNLPPSTTTSSANTSNHRHTQRSHSPMFQDLVSKYQWIGQ